MTIQKANFRQTNDFFRLARSCGFIDAVCFGIPDLSQFAFGFDIVSGNRSSYLNNTMLTREEVGEFSDIVKNFHEEFADDIQSGFHLEGDLNRILSRFQSFAGVGVTPEPRNCRVANNNVVLRASGMLKGCYFLGNYQHIDELATSPEFPARAKFLEIHSPLNNKICRSCDQIDILRPPAAFAAS